MNILEDQEIQVEQVKQEVPMDQEVLVNPKWKKEILEVMMRILKKINKRIKIKVVKVVLKMKRKDKMNRLFQIF